MGSNNRVGIGIIGAGFISEIYLNNLTGVMPNTRVIGVADLLIERAQERATKYGVGAFSVDDLLAHPDVDIVVNLTIPKAHAPVAQQVVEAGKSVYNEKPLTLNRDEAAKLLATARDKGVLVGCAPDTFLGGGLQTARKLIDEGLIGEPIAATASMIGRGHERWHPDPYFYYQPGAGPMLDMGPYYVTALVALLGPVRRVASSARKSFLERTITSKPKFGETIPVNVDTHIVATLDFVANATATIQTTFDLYDTDHAKLVVYGSEGSLRLPDPNTFGGPLQLLPGKHGAEWVDVPLTHGYTENSRGLGVSDMARALLERGTPRASGELANHVLDIMYATLESSAAERHIHLTTTADRPDPMPAI
ncbi:MAG: Gfo/Idh/MocA family oxidoreductase [Thermomicrobiales bacterium]